MQDAQRRRDQGAHEGGGAGHGPPAAGEGIQGRAARCCFVHGVAAASGRQRTGAPSASQYAHLTEQKQAMQMICVRIAPALAACTHISDTIDSYTSCTCLSQSCNALRGVYRCRRCCTTRCCPPKASTSRRCCGTSALSSSRASSTATRATRRA